MKKILVLGAYNSEIEIIKCAKEMGLYTICTDNHSDWTLAPAKYVSDEAWDISWTDYDALVAKCQTENIDGVISGFSEKRVYAASHLCQMLGLPFYTDGARLDTIFNKESFKDACISAGVRVPREFKDLDDIIYPVIVKPSDNAGSRGITICYDEEELNNAKTEALKWSDEKKVIVEEYIQADEVMVYFIIHDGEIELSAMTDRLMNRFEKNVTQLPVGYFYVSRYLEIFKKYNARKFCDLIHKLGIKNGLLAFQAFVVGNDVIPFDPTYRLDGTMTYIFTDYFNHSNALKMLINYSLFGTMGEFEQIKRSEIPEFAKVAFELPILVGKGTIGKIKGIDAVKNLNGVIYVFQSHKEGEIFEKDADFSQILCRIMMVADNLDELKKLIARVVSKIKVFDNNNHDMIIYRFEIDKLASYVE